MSVEAEKALLGAILLGAHQAEILDTISPEEYSVPAHREIASTAQIIRSRGLPVDEIAVLASLREEGTTIELHGGEHYLVELTASCGNPDNWESWARAVQDKSTGRRLALLCEEMRRKAEGGDIQAVVGEMAERLAALSMRQTTSLRQAGDIAAEVIAELDRRCREVGEQKGLRFGIPELDRIICGVRPGEVCVVAADVGGGKSSLADQALMNLVLNQGGTAINFSCEMPATQKVERAFAHLGRINSFKLREGSLTSGDFGSILGIAQRLNKKPYYIQESTNLRSITAQLRAWRTKHPDLLGAFVVDFLQLVTSDEQRGESRARAIGRVAYALKYLAMELKVACLAVSQFNRGPSQRQMAPTKHDLKESGDIEASADSILLIWNESGTDDGHVSIIIDKNRSGPCGTVQTKWTGRHLMFSAADELHQGGHR